MRLLILTCFVCFVKVCFAQETAEIEIDSLYKEDQFYIGVTYNLIGKKPSDLSQSGFSSGIHFGFVKDMPINKGRNLAIGIGIGYSGNSLNENMLITRDNLGSLTYSILDNNNTYTKNRLVLHMMELPIEFRWRTSTATEYKFWRIYTGFKLGYVFSHRAVYSGDLGSFEYQNIETINNIQYGVSASLGYNTWNFYFYYALNPIFSSDAKINGETINMNAVKIGLMFYIL